MSVFENKEEYKNWIESQDWYQTIELKSGLVTPGGWPTHERKHVFESIDFKGKSVIDVGCNSGQNAFYAKEFGANEVVGIDIFGKRIEQAKVLAENEGYDIEFIEKGIFDLPALDKKFDIVLCIAVLTEINDFFGAVESLKSVIGKYALIELDIAKPIWYLSYSKRWLKGYPNLSRRTAVTEVRQIKNGSWVISPSFAVLQEVFGDEYIVKRKSGGVRYNLIEVFKKSD